MEKSKEEYLQLIKNKSLDSANLPKELLQDEEFVRQAYEIDRFIVYYADTQVAGDIYKDIIKENPYAVSSFPSRVVLMCEEETIQALKAEIPIQFKNNIVKTCPRQILINHPELCKELLEQGVSLKSLPAEVLNINSEFVTQLFQQGVLLKDVPEQLQMQFEELCIQHLKDGDYEDNFKDLADGIKINHPEICIDFIKTFYKAGKKDGIDMDMEFYRYIPSELYNNKDFIKAASRIDKDIYMHIPLEFIPREKFKDKNFVQALLKTNKRVIRYIEDEMLINILGQDPIKIGTEWQDECIEKIKDRENVIISSPTGSGKTNVFLQWAMQKQERPIYITAPTKALSNQRWRELQKQGFVAGIETGDIKCVPNNPEFICCTQEIYTQNHTEEEDTTLIMDEFHYIFENEDRTRTYIDSLHYSKAKNILLCSATFGNVDKLTEYISKITGRNFYTYENHDRLTQLEYRGHIKKEDIKNAFVVTFSSESIKIICEYLTQCREQKDEKDIEEINKLAEKYSLKNNDLLKYIKHGLACYYGKMLPKERLIVEELFENKLIDTVVGTDALSVGVNFPIENVVFAQLDKQGYGPISKNLFDQLSGRAGRKGYFDKGYVYYCDDFLTNKQYEQKIGNNDITHLYYELLTAKNRSVSIILKPKIKQILLGNTTVDEEVRYIKEYSNGIKASETDIRYNIVDKLEYIQNYDLISNVISLQFGETNNQEEHMQEIEERKRELTPLQEEFRENIAKVYFDEFTTVKNCRVFQDILIGTTMDDMINKYCNSFRDLLQLRKYVYSLPREYRQNVGIDELEDRINSIDSIALNLQRGAISIDAIAEGVKEQQFEREEMNNILNIMEFQQKPGERAMLGHKDRVIGG